MATTIAAQEGALKAGQTAVSDAKQKIDAKMSQIRGEIDQLSGYWSGGAAAAYTQMMNAWNDETKKINNVLVTLEQNLRTTEQKQEAQEQNATASANKIMQGLAG
ncbi:MAG: WXG100 family type VII secretion target [Bifidobacteriaceae bacterium]|jgi:WXG100 family type VII secretion target|nr:WXG100 family type VII secretion target [Bifidobacteriaceae bacterium]